jgi:glycosyltransferase 2 family protein
VKKIVNIFLSCIIIFGITYYISKDWDFDQLRSLKLNFRYLSISIILLVLHFILVCKLSHQILKSKKGTAFASYMQIYFMSQLGRYIPGKIWMVVGKFEALRRKGFDLYWVTAASFIEMLLMSLGAGIVLASCLVITPVDQFEIISAAAPVLLIIGLFILLFVKPLIALFFRIFQPILKNIEGQVTNHIKNLNNGPLIIISYGYCLSWLIQGIAFYFLIISLKPEIQFSSIFIFTYVAAWLTGFIAIFSPSGIGVRESIMILLLSLNMSTTEATVVSVLARVWSTSVEILITLISVFINRVSSTPEPIDQHD